MDQFPCMLYRFPGVAPDTVRLQDGAYDTATAEDEAALAALVADGWYETPGDAKAAGDAAAQALADAAAAAAEQKKIDDAKALLASVEPQPPTRAEFEQKATELSIAWKPGWSDKKLGDAIATALEA